MLKLRARIRLDDPVQDAGLVEDDGDEDVAAVLAAAGQRARRWRRVGGADRARCRCAGLDRQLDRPSLVRPAPLLDQVGQALAGRHHREDVLLLGDLEPDQRRSVDRLGGAGSRCPPRPASVARKAGIP